MAKSAFELRHVRLSVRPHVSAGLPLEKISVKFVIGDFL
jgi:hypothetical protein